jgi:hypothetical protein
MERGKRDRETRPAARRADGKTRKPHAEMVWGGRGLAVAEAGSSGSGTPDYDAVMPFEDSLPFVIACLIGAVITGFIWLRGQPLWSLATAVVLVLAGVGAFVADQLVVTDREYLQTLFPRLAIAAEKQDVATIYESLDPELRPLREAAEQVLKRVRGSLGMSGTPYGRGSSRTSGRRARRTGLRSIRPTWLPSGWDTRRRWLRSTT